MGVFTLEMVFLLLIREILLRILEMVLLPTLHVVLFMVVAAVADEEVVPLCLMHIRTLHLALLTIVMGAAEQEGGEAEVGGYLGQE